MGIHDELKSIHEEMVMDRSQMNQRFEHFKSQIEAEIYRMQHKLNV